MEQYDIDGNVLVCDANMVTVDNLLTESSYDLSLCAKRLLMIAWAQQIPRRKLSAGEKLLAKVTARDWYSLYPSRKSYADLAAAADELFDAYMVVKPCSISHEKWRFTPRIKYYPGPDLDSAYVLMQFSNEVSTLLNDLFVKYTQYDLREIAELSSAYSIRWFEMIAQFRDKSGRGWIKIEVDKLRVMLAANGKYKRDADFVKRCVTDPLNEIDKKTNLKVVFEVKKKGRKNHMIHVNFEPECQGDLIEGLERKGVSEKEISYPEKRQEDSKGLMTQIMDPDEVEKTHQAIIEAFEQDQELQRLFEQRMKEKQAQAEKERAEEEAKKEEARRQIEALKKQFDL